MATWSRSVPAYYSLYMRPRYNSGRDACTPKQQAAKKLALVSDRFKKISIWGITDIPGCLWMSIKAINNRDNVI